MRIVFLSGGARHRALEKLIIEGENIIAVIVPYLTKSNDRFKKVIEIAKKYNIKILNTNKDDVYKTLNILEYDILVSCGFPYILNENAIKLSKIAINVHPTLLPKYRGYRSGPFIIINGEKKSGVTVHLITKEMDKGDIIIQKEFEVSLFDTTKSLFLKAQKFEVDVLFDAIQMIKSNKVKFLKQDESKASIYNKIRTPKDSEIDENKTLKELYNYIRACDPDDYPAFFYVNGEKVFIKLWRKNNNKEPYQI